VTRRDPVNRAQRRLDRPPRERFATRELAFDADGDTCRGTLYLPGGDDEDSPVVVMAPGLGAERSFGYPAVAERFADAGYAAFLFDYREFGASDGDSQVVDPAGQRADYAAAIDRVQRVDAIGRELVLWGASLSAAHVLTLAERRDVDAVIGAVPMLDGRAIARRRGVKYLARSGVAGVRDLLGHRVGRGRTVPIVWYHRGVGRDHGAGDEAEVPRSGRPGVDVAQRDARAVPAAGGELSPGRTARRDPSADTASGRHPRRHRRQRGGRRRGRDAVARDRRHHARGTSPRSARTSSRQLVISFPSCGTRSTEGRAATSDEAAAPRSVLSVRRPDTQV